MLVLLCISCKQDAGNIACDLRLDFTINGKDLPNSCEIIGTNPHHSETDLVQQLDDSDISIALSESISDAVRLHIDGVKVAPVINGTIDYKLESSGISKITLCTNKNCLSKWIYLPQNKMSTSKNVTSITNNSLQEKDIIKSSKQNTTSNNEPLLREPIQGQVQSSRKEITVDGNTNIKSQSDNNKAASRPVIDSDGDGVPDYRDDCVNEFGSTSNRGCPEILNSTSESKILDSDNDGVPDNDDQCKDVKGLARFYGCPDTDKDGVPDHKDKCAEQRGPERFQGCPDSDRDGVPDNLDKCPEKKGDKNNNGCPVAKVEVSVEESKNLNDEAPVDNIKKETNQNTTKAIRLSSYGSAIIPTDYTCTESVSNFNSGSFQMQLSIKSRVQLISLSVVSNSNWSGNISLKAANGSIINSVSNERILDGVTEINLTQLAKYIEPGDYILEVSGKGQLSNIAACNHTSNSTSQMSIESNNYFFNVDYKY